MKNELRGYINNFIEQGFLDRDDKLALNDYLDKVSLKYLRVWNERAKEYQKRALQIENGISLRLVGIWVLAELCNYMCDLDLYAKLRQEQDKSMHNKYKEMHTITYKERSRKLYD